LIYVHLIRNIACKRAYISDRVEPRVFDNEENKPFESGCIYQNDWRLSYLRQYINLCLVSDAHVISPMHGESKNLIIKYVLLEE